MFLVRYVFLPKLCIIYGFIHWGTSPVHGIPKYPGFGTSWGSSRDVINMRSKDSTMNMGSLWGLHQMSCHTLILKLGMAFMVKHNLSRLAKFMDRYWRTMALKVVLSITTDHTRWRKMVIFSQQPLETQRPLSVYATTSSSLQYLSDQFTPGGR